MRYTIVIHTQQAMPDKCTVSVLETKSAEQMLDEKLAEFLINKTKKIK